MVDDVELLRRYADDRNEPAFAELVQRHLDLVYSVALRQVGGDAHLAEDVSQIVFTALARQAASLAGRAVLGGWLYRTAQFTAIDVVRAESRRRAREQEAQTMMPESSLEPAAGLDAEKIRPMLDRAIGELNDVDRDAVVLRFLNGCSFADVGEKLRLTENAARMRVERALDKMRGALERRGVTSTAAALTAALGGQAGIAAPAGLAGTVTGAALVGAASAGEIGAAGILTFMSTTKTAMGVAVLVAAIGFGVYEANQRSRIESALAASQEDRDRLTAQLAASEKNAGEAELRATKAKEQAATLKRDLDVVFAKKMVPVSNPAALTAMSSVYENGATAFYPVPASSDPEAARQQLRTLNRAVVEGTYLPLYRQLNLTPEQQARFTDLVLDSKERQSALFKKAAAQSSAKDREAIRTVLDVVVEQTQGDLGTMVSAAFGEPVAEAFQRHRETMAVRPVTNQLASALFYTDAPLSVAQAEQVVAILAKNARTADGKVSPAAINQAATLAAAQTVLSAPQLEALGRLIEQQKRIGAGSR